MRSSLAQRQGALGACRALSSVGCLGSAAADEVVERGGQSRWIRRFAEGVVAELAALRFRMRSREVREKGANAGSRRAPLRHHRLGSQCRIAPGKGREPVEAARSFTGRHSLCSAREGTQLLPGCHFLAVAVRAWCDRRRAPSRHGVVWYVAGLLGVLPAAVAELGGSSSFCNPCKARKVCRRRACVARALAGWSP